MEQKDDATTNGARGRATQAVTPRTPGRVEWASVRAATVLLQRSAGPQVAGRTTEPPGREINELELASNMRGQLQLIGNCRHVFHINLLKPYVRSRGVHHPSPQLTDDGQVVFKVKIILQQKDRHYQGSKIL